MFSKELEIRCQSCTQFEGLIRRVKGLKQLFSTIQKDELHLQSYTQVQDLPALWDLLIDDHSLTLKTKYLKALEDQNQFPHYFIFSQNQVVVGIAHLSATHFEMPSIVELMESSKSSIFQKILRRFKFGTRQQQGYILTCGGSSNSGGTSFFFVDGVSHHFIAEALSKAANIVRNSIDHQGYKVSAILFQNTPELSHLNKKKYTVFQAEPMMTLQLSQDWNSFQDYLEALTSKYRVKAKRADTKSSALRSSLLSASELEILKDELHELYTEITQRTKLHLDYPEVDKLAELAQELPESFKIHGYWLEDQFVGYRVSLINRGVLYAHLVGLNYHLNREHSLYPRMLNDYVREGIMLGCHEVCFGRTASEIKSTLGAIPMPSTLYLRHSQPLINLFLPIISKHITSSEFHLHQPFKVNSTK